MSAATCNWPAFFKASLRSAPGFILRAFSSASAVPAPLPVVLVWQLSVMNAAHRNRSFQDKIELRNSNRVGTVADNDDGKWPAPPLKCAGVVRGEGGARRQGLLRCREARVPDHF